MRRRQFLQRAALAATAASFPQALLADPYAPLARPRRRGAPIRVRGRVAAAGRGVPGVAVTDGLSVADTDADGGFTLVTTERQPFVYLSVPAGYAIPRAGTGTARFFAPVQPDAAGEATATFALEPLAEGPAERHAFMALADPQTQDAYEIGLFLEETVPDVAATAQALGRPAFGVAVGDIMFDDLSLYPDYERGVQQMGVPFFQVVGNHDLDFDALVDEGSTATFRHHFGPTYYSFDRGAVHYVVLDDVLWHGAGYLGYLDAGQLAWLEQDLARVEAGRPVVVFAHIPALSTRFRRAGEERPPPSVSITNREALYRLLEPYQAHIVSGHTHESEHVFEGGVHEHVVGAVCGAWWSGPICYDGTPSGYAVFEVDGEEVRWRYKATGHPADHQLRTYPPGADPTTPDAVVANVWDATPEWAVALVEDGVRTPMEARTGTDPLSEKLHAGPEWPERRPWVDPVPTAHLFYARPSPDARDVHVEATDPWGRTFTAPVAAAVEAR